MPDITITDDKRLDMAAGLLIDARKVAGEQRWDLLRSAIQLTHAVYLAEIGAELDRKHLAAAAQDGARAARAPADLAAKARRDFSAIAKKGWATRRKAASARKRRR